MASADTHKLHVLSHIPSVHNTKLCSLVRGVGLNTAVHPWMILKRRGGGRGGGRGGERRGEEGVMAASEGVQYTQKGVSRGWVVMEINWLQFLEKVICISV